MSFNMLLSIVIMLGIPFFRDICLKSHEKNLLLDIEQRQAERRAVTSADRKKGYRREAIDRTVWSEEVAECDAVPVQLNESVQQDRLDVSESTEKRSRVDHSVANGSEGR